MADALHPLIRRTQAKIEAAGAKSQNLAQISGKGLFAVTASPAQAVRIGRLISLLLAAMEAGGWTMEDGDKGIGLLPDGESISFDLVEQTIRRPHKITEAEQAALEKYEAAQARAARSGRMRSRSIERSWRFGDVRELMGMMSSFSVVTSRS